MWCERLVIPRRGNFLGFHKKTVFCWSPGRARVSLALASRPGPEDVWVPTQPPDHSKLCGGPRALREHRTGRRRRRGGRAPPERPSRCCRDAHRPPHLTPRAAKFSPGHAWC
eukprot:gene11055-biopygen13900